MPNEKIRLLDASVIHQLRSSLVINTLVQCVKELVQNALDANATVVDILLDVEKFSVQVNDNGHGIQNLRKIGQRHVTSKCHTLSDVNQLKTFGFRGEALASIINESMTQIISRHSSSKETFEGFWRDGKIIGDISESKYTRKNHPGTSVIVRDLFYKYPVRRRQQLLNAYQHVAIMESIRQLVIDFALCFHHVSFTLTDSTRDSTILATKRSNTSLDIFRQLFGLDMAKHLRQLDTQDNDIQVQGYFSTRGFPSKTYQFIYLNHYFIPTHNELYKVVSEMFSNSKFSSMEKEQVSTTSKGKDRFVQKNPIFMIKFACPKWSSYDIFMYLEMLNEFACFPQIKLLLKQLTVQFLRLVGFLGENETGERPKSQKPKRSIDKQINSPYLSHTPSATSLTFSDVSDVNKKRPRETDSDFFNWWDPSQEKLVYIDSKTGNTYNSISHDSHTEKGHQNKIDRSRLKRAKITQGNNVLNETKAISNWLVPPSLGIPNKLSKHDLQHVRVLGQVDKKYIAVKLLNNNLVMIDQHAADERVKLEELLKTDVPWQVSVLEPTIPVQLDSLAEYQIVTSDRTLKCLKMWGIHITATTNSTTSRSRFFSTTVNEPEHAYRVYVTQLPSVIVDRCIMNHTLLKQVICDYAYWMMEQRDEATLVKTCPKGVVEILKSKACRSAIMFNDELDLAKCEQLVKRLSKCNFPFQCAHGRPSAVPIDLNHLHSSMYYRPKRQTQWHRLI